MPSDLGVAPSDDELDALERHGVDVDRVRGVLHAVLVAPGMIPPSQWLPVAFAGAPPEPASLQIVFRLYNHVGDLLRAGRVLIADPDDEAGRVAFAAGYAAGAALDPSWIGDSARWTFASPLAYLAGRDDLVPPELRANLDADPESRKIILRDLDRIAFTTYGSFAKYRVPTPAPASQARSGTARPGRNEPCPCGSGKKYKRCCIDQA